MKYLFLLLLTISWYSFADEEIRAVDKMKSTSNELEETGNSWRTRAINYELQKTALTKDKLLSTIWVSDRMVDIFTMLMFYSDDIFKIGSISGGVSVTGKYKIENFTLILFDYTPDTFITRNFKSNGEPVTSYLNCESDNVYYNHELVIKNLKFFPTGSKKQNGATAKIDGIKVIVEKNYKVICDSVRFRSEPNAKSKILDVYLYQQMAGVKTGNLIKGTIVYVIAKTEYTEVHATINAPWCFVSIATEEGEQTGWVFGGFFTDYQAEKEHEYWELLSNELNKPKK